MTYSQTHVIVELVGCFSFLVAHKIMNCIFYNQGDSFSMPSFSPSEPGPLQRGFFHVVGGKGA